MMGEIWKQIYGFRNVYILNLAILKVSWFTGKELRFKLSLIAVSIYISDFDKIYIACQALRIVLKP